LRELATAMQEAYADRQQVEELLFYRLDRRLADYAAEVHPLPGVVLKLIMAAQSEGWLADLIVGLLADRPGAPTLRIWSTQHWEPVISPPTVPGEHRMLDSAFFDLLPLKNRVDEARRRDRRTVLGFGVHDADHLVVEKLCAWLPHSLGDSECKDFLSLRPDLAPVDVRVKQALRYLPDLAYVNVICRVLTEGAPVSVLAEFWDGLRAAVGPHPHRFVVLFVGGLQADTGDYPADVERLPAPVVRHEDLYLWAQEVVYRRGWPPALADSWGALLVEQASIGAELDIRYLFEAIDKTTLRARQTPDEFRRHLEGWSRADPAPR
jgi:hypothetical protein